VSGLHVLSVIKQQRAHIDIDLLLALCSFESLLACQVNLLSSTWTAVALGYTKKNLTSALASSFSFVFSSVHF